MKVHSGGGHEAKLAHAPKPAQPKASPHSVRLQDAAQVGGGGTPVAQTGKAELAASGSVGTKLHVVG